LPPKRAEGAPPLGVFGAAVLCFFCIALIVGGSGAAPLSGGVVRMASIPVLGVAIWRLLDRGAPAGSLWPGLLLAAVFALLFAQRIPLPPEIWTRLPGREAALDVYRAAGLKPPSLPISLTSHETWDAILGLLPAAAMFCATLTLSLRARWAITAAAVLMAVCAIGLGMLQMAGGPDSSLRFYAFTNRDSAVGFFANRNHQAALLVCAIPLAAVIAMSRAGEARGGGLFRSVVATAFALVIVVGLGVTRSRAGVLLLGPAVIGAVLIALRGQLVRRDGSRDPRPALALSAAVVLGVALVATFSLTPLANRFQASITDDARYFLTPTTAAAGVAYAPTGAGVGAFVPVYQTFEGPQMLMRAYANHAHNDYVELWLETGWAGAGLFGLFLLWWALTTVRVLRSPDDAQGAFALAGAVVVALLLAHSFADYPLRAPALSTLFAFACGLMVPASRRAARGREEAAPGLADPARP